MTFTTALGPLTLERAWYHCERCHNGFSPRDRALGMEHTFLSPAALRMIGIAAARTSFEGSSALLRELAGLTLAFGRTPRRGPRAATWPRTNGVIEPEPCDAPTVYLGLDGTGVPARKSEVEGRQGKQPDGSADLAEAKLAVYGRRKPSTKTPVDAGSATYNAAIDRHPRSTPSLRPSHGASCARRVSRLDKAARRDVLGDGAPWRPTRLPRRHPEVDIFHAEGHLFEVAKAIYGRARRIGER